MRHYPPLMAAPTPVPLTHTRRQASKRLGVGLSLLDRLIDGKEIRTIKIGARVLVPEAELQRYVATKATAGR